MKKKIAMLLTAALVATSLVACGGSGDQGKTEEKSAASASAVSSSAAAESTSTSATEEKSATAEASTTGSSEIIVPDLSGQDIYIGIATGSSGTAWRDQGVRHMTDALDEYVANGDIAGYTFSHNTNNGDANEQAEVIRNFVADDKVNVILVNPNDATALNEAMLDAANAGKLVIAYDATVTAPGILNVTLDHYTYAYEPTLLECEIAGGKGKAVEISGLDGHPADVTRIGATDDALKEYPDVELVQNTPGGWDQTTAKSVMASILAAGVEPDMVISQDSECYGILQACLDADYIPKVVSGDSTRVFFEEWKKIVDSGADFDAVVAPNPPGIGVTALRFAVNLAQGKTFKDGVLEDGVYYYAVAKFYTNENFDEGWELVKDLSDEEQLDEWLSVEEADALFN